MISKGIHHVAWAHYAILIFPINTFPPIATYCTLNYDYYARNYPHNSTKTFVHY